MEQFAGPSSENQDAFAPLSDPMAWKRPWYRLHAQTLALFLALILGAAIFEILPNTDRADRNMHVIWVAAEYGFPLTYALAGLESTKINSAALFADFATVGAIIIALTLCMEKWMRLEGMPLWYKLHPRSWVLLAVSLACGVILGSYPFITEYTFDEARNHPDDFGGIHWLGKGFPFTYYRVDPAESLEPHAFRTSELRSVTFEPAALVFDFLLIGLVVAEAVYWFERRQRRREPFVLIEEK
jgi:hypothetical protein